MIFRSCRRAEGVVALAHDEDSILTDWSGRDDLLQLSAEAWFRAGGVLAPGASISSGRLAFVCAADPADALADYAQAIADVHDVRVKPSPTGWTHWFYTHEYIDEAEILANAKFIARNAAGYGIDYVQVDSGYQAAYGEWEGNERFPHGMKWLAGKLRDLGLKPGLWIAPFLISEGTEIAERHSDWLLRDPDGTVKKCGGGLTADWSAAGHGEWGCPSMARNIFGLDVTHPEAAAWLHDLFDTVANEWGYEFIKVDHLDWSLLAADAYWDPACTRAEAHRRAFEIMRDAVGRDKHLLVCGPALPVAGLVDSARIDQDLNELNWEQYAGHSNSSGPSMAKRGCFNGRTWVNDPDHLGVAQLSIAEAQAAATLIAFSGGTTFLGDRLIDLDTVRLDILKRVLPAYGQTARPVDLFESDRPQVFVLPLSTSFAQWTVVAVFNYDEHTSTERTIAFEELGLDPSKAYVAYDFWRQRSVGELRDELRLRLDPASVTVLAVHERRSVPHLLSTDRHVTQGAVELETVVWDDELAALTGVSLGPLGTAHSVAIAVPSGYEWADHSRFFAERGAYSLKLVEADVLRVRPRFDTCERIEWTVEFIPVDKSAGQQDQ